MRVTRKLFADGHCRMAHAKQRRAVSGLRLGVQGLEPGNRQMAIEMRREWGSDSVVGSQPSLKGASSLASATQDLESRQALCVDSIAKEGREDSVSTEGRLTEFQLSWK